MTTREIQDAITHKALELAVFEGWTDSMLEHATKQAGFYDVLTAKRVFPEGVADVLEHYRMQIDEESKRICELERDAIAVMRMRDKIAYFVMLRLRLQEPHKEALKRAFAHAAIPTHTLEALTRLWHTADSIWKLAGDSSVDFNYYTKRITLSKVYLSTLLCWFNDTSEHYADTDAFLHRRIDNVMQFEKLKAKVKKWFA
jgi:ubiquinone biosynthesis protein COQ9